MVTDIDSLYRGSWRQAVTNGVAPLSSPAISWKSGPTFRRSRQGGDEHRSHLSADQLLTGIVCTEENFMQPSQIRILLASPILHATPLMALTRKRRIWI